MNVSPLDLRQQKFRTTLRGLDPVEVAAFLTAAADDYEEAMREADRLRQEVTRLETVVRGHVEQEKSLQNMLLTAQKLADDMRATAEENAIRIVKEAEARSEALIQKAQSRVEDIQRDVDGLMLKKRDAETAMETTIQALQNTLDFVREQDTRDRDDRVVIRRPRLLEAHASVG